MQALGVMFRRLVPSLFAENIEVLQAVEGCADRGQAPSLFEGFLKELCENQ